MTAALEDQSEYIKDRMPLFIAGVVGLSFLLLLVAFHSPLISLKAGVMNLLSVGAAYGVMTLVAKGGAVGGLIGIDQEVPIAPFMPVMMFAILFGLSMDYEVFLISRIREEYLKDGDTRRAVADGLAKTARVITAAAAIMVVVFLAFVAAPDVFLKLFGIGLASAIFLDATIVRMVLVPAVMQLLGSRNWWIPAWLERRLPTARRRARRGRRRGPALIADGAPTPEGEAEMTETIRDPVSRVRMSFAREGEDLVVDAWLEPGGGLPAHHHPRQEERWSVIEGSARFRLGDDERVIGPADGEVVVEPGVVHALASAGAEEAHLRCRAIPALRLQEFLEESSRAGREGLFTARGLPRGLSGVRWAAGFLKRYRDETVFASPPQIVQRALIALLARDG